MSYGDGDLGISKNGSECLLRLNVRGGSVPSAADAEDNDVAVAVAIAVLLCCSGPCIIVVFTVDEGWHGVCDACPSCDNSG